MVCYTVWPRSYPSGRILNLTNSLISVELVEAWFNSSVLSLFNLHSSMNWQLSPEGSVQAGSSASDVVACGCAYCRPGFVMIVRRWGNEKERWTGGMCAAIRSVWVHTQYKQFLGSGRGFYCTIMCANHYRKRMCTLLLLWQPTLKERMKIPRKI